MSDKKKPSDVHADDVEKLREYGKKATDGLFNSNVNSDFDENELASGSENILDKTDAELFPSEIEEYTKDERRPRIVVDNKKK